MQTSIRHIEEKIDVAYVKRAVRMLPNGDATIPDWNTTKRRRANPSPATANTVAQRVQEHRADCEACCAKPQETVIACIRLTNKVTSR